MISQNGTLHYRAPESFKGGFYGIEVDMWAVGIIAFEMLTGKAPFKTSFVKDTINLILNEKPPYEQY